MPRHKPASVPFLTFQGAGEHDPAIGRWLDALPADLAGIARRWYQAMRRCGPDVLELMHDGWPTVCVGDAPFAYLSAFRDHLNVGFFHGSGLPDPAGLLLGGGRFMRHVKLWPSRPVDDPSLEALLSAAYRDIVARRAAARLAL